MSDYHQILEEQIGLTKNEAKIYLILLSEYPLNTGKICEKTLIHRRNVYDSAQRLIDKGLIYEIFDNSQTMYYPVDPGKLEQIIREKQTKLSAILPDLFEIYQKTPESESTMIYRGVEGFKNYLRSILQTRETVYAIGATGDWFDPKIKDFMSDFWKEKERLGIKSKILFDSGVKDMQEVLDVNKAEHKFLPKQYSTNSVIDVFGDKVVMFTGIELGRFNPDITIFTIVSKDLANSYRTWFEMIWNSTK